MRHCDRSRFLQVSSNRFAEDGVLSCSATISAHPLAALSFP